MTKKQVLWWSRSGRDYSRDRIIRQSFGELGWNIVDFRPAVSFIGDWQAAIQRLRRPDLVWVPCFRHRDAAAAARWARARNVPVIFDPLISAYDKKVFEKESVAESSRQAESLRRWESRLMTRFDRIIADTQCHAEFYASCFQIPPKNIHVIPVGAEDGVFVPQAFPATADPVRVLFYGSFIGLQGPEIIARAAKLTSQVHWTFIGDGPLRDECLQICSSLPHVEFIPWVPYETLPGHIGRAHILLGVFGTSAKAGRVIPNKVYQALACGRVVITQPSKSYPPKMQTVTSDLTGLAWCPPGNPEMLAQRVLQLASKPEHLKAHGMAARKSYTEWFSGDAVRRALMSVIQEL